MDVTLEDIYNLIFVIGMIVSFGLGAIRGGFRG